MYAEKIKQLRAGTEKEKLETRREIGIPTVAEALEKYIEIRRVPHNSAREYRNRLNNHLADWLPLRLDKINGIMVEDRHREVSQKTPAMADCSMRTLSMIFTWACGYWLTPKGRPLDLWNPVERLTIIRAWHRKRSRKQEYIRDEDLALWWKEVHAIENVHVRDMLIFMVLTGVRPGEAMGLRYDDINFRNSTFTIKRSSPSTDETKTGSPLTLPMSDYTWNMLQRRREMFPVSVYCFQGRSPDRPIASVYYVTRAINKACGVPFKPHGLRRTYINISTHPDIGANELAIKTMLNHTRGDVTHAHYLTPHIEMLRPIVQGVTNFVLNKVGERQGETEAQHADIHNPPLRPNSAYTSFDTLS